jgi:hypothetical protein
MLVIVGVIHLLPLVGVLGSEQLVSLYGLDFAEPNLAILMRHRAVLFGVLGTFLVYAAFKPALQPMAFAAGFVSVASFVLLAWNIGGYNSFVGKVVIVDIVALVCLLVGVVVHVFSSNEG